MAQESMEVATLLGRCKGHNPATDLLPACFRCGVSGELSFMQVYC